MSTYLVNGWYPIRLKINISNTHEVSAKLMCQAKDWKADQPTPAWGRKGNKPLSPLSSLPASETLHYLPVLTSSTVASGQDWPVVTSVSSGPWPSSPWLPPPRLRSHWELWPRECNGTDVVTPCQLALEPHERPLVPLHYLAEMGPCRTKTDITLSLSNWLNFGFITHMAFRFHHLITVNQRSTWHHALRSLSV